MKEKATLPVAGLLSMWTLVIGGWNSSLIWGRWYLAISSALSLDFMPLWLYCSLVPGYLNSQL